MNKHWHQRGATDNTWQDVLMLFTRKQPDSFYLIEFNALHWKQWATVTKAWQDREAEVILDKEKFPENSKSPFF